MALLMGVLFVGSIGLTQYLAVVAGPQETILSALARRILGNGPAYLVIQVSTLLILAVAANTSFAGFPRAGRHAGAGRLPAAPVDGPGRPAGVRQRHRARWRWRPAALIVVFGGDSHALIPLFAVGAFLAFTLSQAGMVIHWRRERTRGWTSEGSDQRPGGDRQRPSTWPSCCSASSSAGRGSRHRDSDPDRLASCRSAATTGPWPSSSSLRGLPPSLKPVPPARVVVPISGIHRGIVDAIGFARSIARDVTAVYVELEPGSGERIREEWQDWWPDVPIVVVPSPYRSIVGPLLDFLDETDREHNDGQLAAVVLPEFVPGRTLAGAAAQPERALLKMALPVSAPASRLPTGDH